MREFTLFSFNISVLILLCCKSHKTFSVDIDTQGLKARHNYVESEVKLVAVQQQWVVYVPRYNTGLTPIDLLETVHEIDSTTS